MNNKRVLQIATKELDKRKAPPAPKDIIVDPAGQWKYPGQVTRIPSNTITMQGVPYPVMGVPNKGEPTMMQPGQYYEFPNADYVDEYPQMKKGGGLKSKKYTRSLEGIGELFRESALFKKPKSKKKKLFHPNAKYYQDGGLMTQDEIDGATEGMMKARLAYAQMHGNPAAQRMVVAPDQPYVFDDGDTGTHFMASMDNYAVPLIQDVNGQLMLGDYGPESAEAMRFDNPEDAMYFADHYKEVAPAFIEADLSPEEIQEYAKGGFIIEELDNYAEGGDPGDVQCPPGYVYNPETKYCEKKSGCPEGYTFDPKSGRCISNYQKESIKIMTAPYKLYNEQNAGDPDNIGAPIKNPEYYEDSELVEATPEQLTVNKSGGLEWPKDFTINEIENPIYIRPSTNYSIKRPDYKEEYEGETEYEIEGFPDLNYKVVVDPKKQEGFNKDESVYYVKSENTHQFKKYKEWEKLKALEKQNLENAKKYGFEIVNTNQKRGTKYDDDYYRKQLSETVNGEKEWSYDEDGNPLYEYSPEWDQKKYYKEDATPIQEWYNDPEYLGDIAYNKSFEEVYKDRGKTNVQKYSGWCPQCTYYHGERYTVDDDYIYGAYNPSNNPIVKGQFVKPVKTLENEYADPSIDQQMPTIEEYPYPEGPGYNPASYKGKGIHPTYGYDKKARTHIGMHPGKRDSLKDKFYVHTTWDDDKDFRGFGTHDRTKLLPFIVQKSTGYNPEGMEGYYDEENNWVPGEYEKAAEEGRKINFQGAASLRDLRNQKEYQLKYEQYLKEKADIDKMNKELRQEWLPEPEVANQYAEGGATCPPGYIKIGGKCVPAGNQPTFQDSLDVYNMQMRQNAYYNKYKKFFNKTTIHKSPIAIEVYTGDLSSGKNRKESIEALRKQYNLQKDRYNFYVTNSKAPFHMRGEEKEKWEKSIKKNIAESKKKMQQIRSAIEEHYPSRNNKHYYKDLITGVIDPNAPTSYYHDKIKPQGLIERDANMKLRTPFDGIDVTTVYYDPLAIKPAKLLSDKEIIERFKKYGESGIPESRLKRLKLTPDPKKETKPQYKEAVKKKPEEHKYPTTYLPVVDNTPKVTPEGKVQVGTEKVMTLDPKTGKVKTVITPVYEDQESKRPTPTPTYVNPELQKFVEEKKPEPPGPPPGTGTDVMPVYYIDELPEYATPDPDAEWVGQTERYIDWDANRIPYRLPKFRKPGHGGDLIKPGKRRYIPIPGIETRNSAYIQREDEEYKDGGEPKKKKNKNVKTFVTSDPEEYAFRKAAYEDSLHLARKYNAREPRANRAITYHGVVGSRTGRPKKLERGYTPNTHTQIGDVDHAGFSPAWRNYLKANDYKLRGRHLNNTPIGYDWERSFFDKRAIVTPFSFKTFTLPGEDELEYLDMKPRFQPPVQPVKFVSPDDKKKNTSNKHLIKKPVPKVTEEPLPPVVVQEKPIPVPPGPPPGIPPTPPKPEPPKGYPGIMPVYDIDETPMYATPDPDAQWVDNTRRYIDWDGNSVGYNLPRFRKPGHGGDLIRKGKRRYLHFPSIETRYEAEIVPEEEYAMGGEYTIGDEVELSEAEVQRLRALGYIIEEA